MKATLKYNYAVGKSFPFECTIASEDAEKNQTYDSYGCGKSFDEAKEDAMDNFKLIKITPVKIPAPEIINIEP